MTTEGRREAFIAGTAALAAEFDLPVLTAMGDIQPDPHAAALISHIGEWHERTQEPRVHPGWFHASSLGRTDEDLIREYRGLNDDRHRAPLLRIFDYGHNRDAAWKRYLHGAGLSVFPDPEDEDARRMSIDAIKLTGRCDDIIRLPGYEGEPWVFEFKTCNAYVFGQLREPKPEHVLQAHSYMAGFGLSDAIVLYECKNNAALLGFHVPFNIATWMDVTSRLRRLRKEAERSLRVVPSADGRAKAAALEQ